MRVCCCVSVLCVCLGCVSLFHVRVSTTSSTHIRQVRTCNLGRGPMHHKLEGAYALARSWPNLPPQSTHLIHSFYFGSCHCNLRSVSVLSTATVRTRADLSIGALPSQTASLCVPLNNFPEKAKIRVWAIGDDGKWIQTVQIHTRHTHT